MLLSDRQVSIVFGIEIQEVTMLSTWMVEVCGVACCGMMLPMGLQR
jgi:hypothetical protein